MTETLGGAGERAVLARILSRLPASDSTALGPGDDSAVLRAPDGRMVISTDLLVHGPDFRLAWSTPFDLGWKAAATNLADIAAMGAVPTALVVALAAPAGTPVADLEGIADGLREGCAALAPGAGVIGGDLSASATLTIAVTVFGDLGGREAVLRSGARPGDVVAVAGCLGSAAAGLRLLFERAVDAGGEPDPRPVRALAVDFPALLGAQLRPEPPILAGMVAADAGATAMLDVSDGLLLDADRIAAASGVLLDLSAAALAADIDRIESAVPDFPGAALVLTGGEDHALLATFPPGAVPPGFRVLGEVREGSGVLVDGADPASAVPGWDPFAGWDGRVG